MAFALSSCTKHEYIRPAGELELGKIKDLLYTVVHVRNKATLVYRDDKGWRALSLRCTYSGCDLTYQPPVLLCPCCRAEFSLEGKVYAGSSATVDLPWMEMSYRDGSRYANPGNIKEDSYNFTLPAIEQAIQELRQRVKAEAVSDNARIPDILMGKGDGENEPGSMFLDADPTLLQNLDNIK